MLVIWNRPGALRSSHFENTRAITSWIVLHSVPLLLLIVIVIIIVIIIIVIVIVIVITAIIIIITTIIIMTWSV